MSSKNPAAAHRAGGGGGGHSGARREDFVRLFGDSERAELFPEPRRELCACNAAAPAFAAASPAAPNGCMSASDRAMFAANEHADIFTGVLVSLAEWNPRVAKVAIEKNGSPATAADYDGRADFHVAAR